eukprot:9208210-Pyramimonas_sp.AAC.1
MNMVPSVPARAAAAATLPPCCLLLVAPQLNAAQKGHQQVRAPRSSSCLLYTSDAADDTPC